MSVSRFREGKYYKVTVGPLKGYVCKLSRPLVKSSGAWMEALRDLPVEFTAFDLFDERRRNFVLYPEEADPADEIDVKMCKSVGYP